MLHASAAFLTCHPVGSLHLRSRRLTCHSTPLTRPCRTTTRCSLNLTTSNNAELSPAAPPRRAHDRGTLLLCMLCVAGYVLDHVACLPLMKGLYLYHGKFNALQLVSSLFCHGSFDHLSSNLFPLLIFGRFVEEEAGAAGVVFAFLLCGACANVASLLLLSGNTVSVGASGAVFSLFTLAVLVRFRLRVGRLVEAFILSTHVASRLRNEFATAARGGAGMGAVRINHVAHVAGAFAGVLLVVLLNLIVRRFEPPLDKEQA